MIHLGEHKNVRSSFPGFKVVFIMVFTTDTACLPALFPLGLDLTKINELGKYLYLTSEMWGSQNYEIKKSSMSAIHQFRLKTTQKIFLVPECLYCLQKENDCIMRNNQLELLR